jgi:hypothetical protein
MGLLLVEFINCITLYKGNTLAIGVDTKDSVQLNNIYD